MNAHVERFVQQHGSYNGISPARLRFVAKSLREFEDSLSEHELLEAGGPDLRAWLGSLVEKGLHPNTVRKYRNAVRPFFTWAWEQKLVTAEQLMEIRAVKPPRGACAQGKPNPYKRTEIQGLWADVDEHYPLTDEQAKWVKRFRSGQSKWGRVEPYAWALQIRAIVSLAVFGGLRRNEIFRLTVDEAHYDGDYVVVRGARKNQAGEEVARAVPFVAPMRDAVQAWIDFRETLGPDHEGMWLSLHRTWRARPLRVDRFNMLLVKLGDGWSFHRLRHTAATEMLRAGQPLENVQRILGHTRIEQTLAYAQLLGSDLVKASQRVESDFTRALAPATRRAA